MKHLTFPENKLNFPQNVLLQVTKSSVGKKKKTTQKDSDWLLSCNMTWTLSCNDVLPKKLTKLPNASLTEFHSDDCQKSEWMTFLQRLNAIKRNKNMHVDTCELCKQESDYTINASWGQQVSFSTKTRFWIIGMDWDPLQAVCWQYRGVCWSTKYMFSKILPFFNL